mmetsp:Transcript_33914/g.32358  ORF Transcript_33914/g.32358 Transcript_33914/m.32358 type:complete len:180 (-) Transcript_33914:695-1234(-)
MEHSEKMQDGNIIDNTLLQQKERRIDSDTDSDSKERRNRKKVEKKRKKDHRSKSDNKEKKRKRRHDDDEPEILSSVPVIHRSNDTIKSEAESAKIESIALEAESSKIKAVALSKAEFFANLLSTESQKPPVGTSHAAAKKEKEAKKTGSWICQKCENSNFNNAHECNKCKSIKRLTEYR